jgi:AAA+ ATPase superfamily predicted ATPase
VQQDLFVGREEEVSAFNALLKKKTASLLVVRGRRRVGKSRLIDEITKGIRRYKFTGLAPVDGVTDQDQRDEFARSLSEQTDLPEMKTDDWAKLFSLLARELKRGRVIVILDEISWMAKDDATFLPKLKNAWEESFKKNPQLILIFCGSVSTWIEENIISSTAFFGRISWTLDLGPLSLRESNKMLEAHGFKSSTYEKFKILSVTGGIPWYLEQIQGQYSAEQNIKRQCFTKGGVLANDFNLIFHELFEKRDFVYKKIIESLEGGPISYSEISELTHYPESGTLSKYLDELEQAGFIIRDYTWSLKTGESLDLSFYRLSDNYIRFYLKYIAPKKRQIESNKFKEINMSNFSGLETMLGLQFENLVVNNRHELYRVLNIDPTSIIYDNPFFQRKTTRQKGCQIDFLMQTKFKTLYVCEVRFSKNTLGRSVIDEVKEKIARISLPRGINVLPVLIHVNGVSEAIIEEDYFYSTIDFGQLLT